MKYICKGKVVTKSGYITSNKKQLQFLFQYFPSLNSTEDDESYFQNLYFSFATHAAHDCTPYWSAFPQPDGR